MANFAGMTPWVGRDGRDDLVGLLVPGDRLEINEMDTGIGPYT